MNPVDPFTFPLLFWLPLLLLPLLFIGLRALMGPLPLLFTAPKCPLTPLLPRGLPLPITCNCPLTPLFELLLLLLLLPLLLLLVLLLLMLILLMLLGSAGDVKGLGPWPPILFRDEPGPGTQPPLLPSE